MTFGEFEEILADKGHPLNVEANKAAEKMMRPVREALANAMPDMSFVWRDIAKISYPKIEMDTSWLDQVIPKLDTTGIAEAAAKAAGYGQGWTALAKASNGLYGTQQRPYALDQPVRLSAEADLNNSDDTLADWAPESSDASGKTLSQVSDALGHRAHVIGEQHLEAVQEQIRLTRVGQEIDTQTASGIAELVADAKARKIRDASQGKWIKATFWVAVITALVTVTGVILTAVA